MSSDAETLNFSTTPGVESIALLHSDGVHTAYEVTYINHTVDSAVVVNSGYAWINDLYFTPYTANYEEREVDLEGDNAWQVRIECFRPYTDEDDIYAETLRERKRYLADCVDKDGRRRLVGNENEFLTLKQTFSTGSKPGDRKGTVYVLEGTFRNRPPFYSP